MTYWMHTTEKGEHQVRTTNGQILFRYAPNMEAAASEHVRRLQTARKADARREAIANALTSIADLATASDPKAMERALKQIRKIADEALA